MRDARRLHQTAVHLVLSHILDSLLGRMRHRLAGNVHAKLKTLSAKCLEKTIRIRRRTFDDLSSCGLFEEFALGKSGFGPWSLQNCDIDHIRDIISSRWPVK